MTYDPSFPHNSSSPDSAPVSSAGYDFNDATPQGEYELIPDGTIARVVMSVKPGGYIDAKRGWHDGYATCNPTSGSVYLSCAYTVMEPPYVGRKVWGLIGLHSPKGETWFQMGRSFIRAILNSARGFSEKDESVPAMSARHLNSYAELQGMEFVAKIEVEKNPENGKKVNVIKTALTPDHKDYTKHTGYYAGTAAAGRGTASYAQAQSQSHGSSQQAPSQSQPAWSR